MEVLARLGFAVTHGGKKNPQKAWPSGTISRQLGHKQILVRAVSTQSTFVHSLSLPLILVFT